MNPQNTSSFIFFFVSYLFISFCSVIISCPPTYTFTTQNKSVTKHVNNVVHSILYTILITALLSNVMWNIFDFYITLFQAENGNPLNHLCTYVNPAWRVTRITMMSVQMLKMNQVVLNNITFHVEF